MGNFSNAKFAIGRVAQSNKDVPVVTEMVRFPIAYGGGFEVMPEVDTYGDLVENQFESSLTSILSATVRGQIEMPANADALALLLSSVMGSVISTNIGVGQTFTAVAATDVCTATNHQLANGQKVKVSSDTTLPAGLSEGTVYYAGSLTASTFKLYTTYSAAINGSGAVDITDTGTGTHTMTPETYTHTITPASTSTPNFHTILFDDGTCDRRVVGAVPISLAFGCSIDVKRMNLAVDFTAIRREFNDATPTMTFTAATNDICTVSSNTFSTGHAVRLTTTNALPGGLSTGTTYYVGAGTATTFKLYTTFEGACLGGTTDLVDISSTGTGTHTVTAYDVSYPSQEAINPFHFTNSGAELKITIAGTETAYTTKWAAFDYSLTNAIAAEQRGGSNTYRVIEKVDRAQGLNLALDYSDSTFKDIVQGYQASTNPQKLKIELTLRGKLIGQSDYFKIKGTFYNCYLGTHSYTTDPNIGKQMLALSVNHDEVAGKSCDWVITNDVDSYLT